MTYQALNQYKQNTVLSATPEELTLMLYDGAIKFMNIGKHNIELKNYPKAHEALVRAQDIVNELNYSLDMRYELSNELRELYNFVSSKLIDANIKKNTSDLDEAVSIISEMRETWKEVVKQIKQKVYQSK